MAVMDTVRRQPRGTEFGEFLRGARERRGLTLQQVSNETKIPWRHLDAFEHGDLTIVPHGMYRRAEVRAYARAVGLDQHTAITELERALVASGLTAAPPETHARIGRPMVLTALGIAGVASALLATWLLWTKTSVEVSGCVRTARSCTRHVANGDPDGRCDAGSRSDRRCGALGRRHVIQGAHSTARLDRTAAGCGCSRGRCDAQRGDGRVRGR